jgi:uncharacterized protein (UPF0335 family)
MAAAQHYDTYNPAPFQGAKSKNASKAAAKTATGGLKPASPMFDPEETGETRRQTVAAGKLRAFIERIERLAEDKQAIADDIKEVFAELKGTGFDVKAVRQIIHLRKKDQAECQEE